MRKFATSVLRKSAPWLAVLLTISSGWAQAPGVPIETRPGWNQNKELIKQGTALRDSGKLLDHARVTALMAQPQPAPVVLPPAQTQPLAPREIARRARQSALRFGWFYLCSKCEHWHFNLANAYVVTTSGVIATCNHCLTPPANIQEGYLIAINHQNEILPVTNLLARSEAHDAALLQVEGTHLLPLPLNDQVAPGDPAYLLSDPLGTLGYFSSGMVNRFYWLKGEPADPQTLDGVKDLRLNVSTDWAPGSSGAAVLDENGNAIGHVATISPMSESPKKANPDSTKKRDRFDGATLITLHEAIPARAVLLLAKSLATAAKPSPKPVPYPEPVLSDPVE